MNELFWECLSANTSSPFELIIIDNHSTDGSEHLFQNLSQKTADPNRRIIYIRNEKNQSYPVSQIQGMEKCLNNIMIFLNNDIWMPKNWHVPLERELEKHPFLVVCPSGQEAQPTQRISDRLKRRWKQVQFRSRLWQKLFRTPETERLRQSLRWMYGDLEEFSSPTPYLEPGYFHGIKGDCIAFRRELLSVHRSPWNPKIEAADWHLYLSMADLHEDNPDVPLPRVLLDTYVHHFGRYSVKMRSEPTDNREPFLSIEEVWGENKIKKLWFGNSLPRE